MFASLARPGIVDEAGTARNAGRDPPDFTASLVALPTTGDFICAKDLFVEAMDGKSPSH
jgi:hypothetical protein